MHGQSALRPQWTAAQLDSALYQVYVQPCVICTKYGVWLLCDFVVLYLVCLVCICLCVFVSRKPSSVNAFFSSDKNVRVGYSK